MSLGHLASLRYGLLKQLSASLTAFGLFFRSIQRSCSSEKLFDITYFSGNFFRLLAGRAKPGWHSNTVIRCYENLLSLSFVMNICYFGRLETVILMIFEYFLEVLCHGRFFESYF